MSPEKIVEITRQVGGFDATPKFLEAFANLVAQLERERIATSIERLPFGDTAASFAIYVRELKDD
jgi:hypothetical protein